ncbi:MAG: hypothetical protein Kow0032_01930 [Methyloligellaceae bacterium]
MFRKALIATAAIAAITAGTLAAAPSAEAGVNVHIGFGPAYGFGYGPWAGYGYGWGYGHHHHYRHRHHHHHGHKCFYKKYPVTITKWTHYGPVYKTFYKKKYVCH